MSQLDLLAVGVHVEEGLPGSYWGSKWGNARLWKLPLDLIPDVPLFAYTRKRLRGESMADLLVEAVRRQVG
ncbi:MAG TPA: hypothetical protein ENK02_01995 [Planctomycetes bacterium]|nr:hypothetical protein [Planctomycetota bacterium]